MGIFFFVLKGDFIYESNLKHYKLLKCKYPTPMYPSQYLIMKLECHTAAIRIHIIQYCFPLLHKSFFKFFTYNHTYSLSALICNHKITTLYIWLWLSGIINTAITNICILTASGSLNDFHRKKSQEWYTLPNYSLKNLIWGIFLIQNV